MTSEELAALAASTLEEAAFVLSQRASSPPKHGADQLLVARIPLGGLQPGALYLAGTRDFATLLLESLLGELPEEGARHQQGDDALQEMLNVLGGELCERLTAQAGGEAELGLPTLEEQSEGSWAESFSQHPLRASLVTEEGHRVDVAAHFES